MKNIKLEKIIENPKKDNVIILLLIESISIYFKLSKVVYL